MRILLTGANGFVGAWLTRDILHAGIDLLATGSGHCRIPMSGSSPLHYQPMELTDPLAIMDVFNSFQPDIVIHSGAMSRPDECELNQEKAWDVNVNATSYLLEQSAVLKARFIFLSTDFVFDGSGGPYSEEDRPAPVNYYGHTKYEAEKRVMAYAYDWAIVRTILVYGNPIVPRNYLLNIVADKLGKGEEYKLVNDQYRSPTYVNDLSSGILSIVSRKAKGIFHLSGEDRLTPYQMGCEWARRKGLDAGLLTPVTADNFKEPALRPMATSFVLKKSKELLGYQPHSFSEALSKMMV